MKRKDINTSTGSPTSVKNSTISSVFEWGLIWWPILLLLVILLVAGITKYLYPSPTIYSLMLDLTKAIGLIMVVVYVIYTRILAIETQKMAEASMGLYSSEKGMVLAEPIETTCNYSLLLDDAKKLTNNIHIEDKKFTKDDCTSLYTEKNIPAISLKIKNISGRRIEASKIDCKARHTGCDKFHEVVYDIAKVGTIVPWADMLVPLILAPEGEIEVIINSFYYLDGGIVQKVNVSKGLLLERIRKPETSSNG